MPSTHFLPHRSLALTALSGILFLMPALVFGAPSNFKDLILQLTVILELVLSLLSAMLILVFLWGIARFILSAGGGEKKAEDKMFLFWATIALFVMFSVWGLITIIKNTLLV